MKSASPYRLQFDEPKVAERVSRSIPLCGHHIGTARVATSAQLGVVNTERVVFNLPNLYVGSSAVFPTSSQANPALTIVALTVQLGEHLKATLGQATQANMVTNAS